MIVLARWLTHFGLTIYFKSNVTSHYQSLHVKMALLNISMFTLTRKRRKWSKRTANNPNDVTVPLSAKINIKIIIKLQDKAATYHYIRSCALVLLYNKTPMALQLSEIIGFKLLPTSSYGRQARLNVNSDPRKHTHSHTHTSAERHTASSSARTCVFNLHIKSSV